MSGKRLLSVVVPCYNEELCVEAFHAAVSTVMAPLAERVEVVLCQFPAEAAAGSNLILMASGAYEPLVTLDMIRPGTTIIGIEGFRDLDPRIGKRAEK